MIDINKYPKVIDKLIKFTQSGNIIWKPLYIPTYGTYSTIYHINNSYVVNIQHLTFRFIEYTFKLGKPSIMDKILLRKPVIKTGYKLEILSGENVIDVFPPTDNMEELCNIIKSKTIDIDKILDEIINESV